MIEGLLSYSRVGTKGQPAEVVDLNEVLTQIRELELAVLIDEKELAKEVSRRRKRCLRILEMSPEEGGFERGLVSIAILSCMRLPSLQRLVASLHPFLEAVEDYRRVEVVLVDNVGEPPVLVRKGDVVGTPADVFLTRLACQREQLWDPLFGRMPTQSEEDWQSMYEELKQLPAVEAWTGPF